MKTTALAIHGEYFGDLHRMPNNTEAGFGPAYVSDRDGPGWVCSVVDSHWPQHFYIRCASFEEVVEHAEICLFPIDEELEQEAAQLGEDWSATTDLIYENDATVCADGRVRVCWALHVQEVRPR